MKITEEEFRDMKAKYAEEVGIGKIGQGSKGEIIDQTDWISYTKEDLMEALGQDGVTGMKFYFVEYSEKVAEDLYGKDGYQYVGRLGLVYSPILATSDATASQKGASRDEYYDKGTTCPPSCR
jgi:hypothetical protein